MRGSLAASAVAAPAAPSEITRMQGSCLPARSWPARRTASARRAVPLKGVSLSAARRVAFVSEVHGWGNRLVWEGPGRENAGLACRLDQEPFVVEGAPAGGVGQRLLCEGEARLAVRILFERLHARGVVDDHGNRPRLDLAQRKDRVA